MILIHYGKNYGRFCWSSIQRRRKFSKKKFEQINRGIKTKNTEYNLKTLVRKYLLLGKHLNEGSKGRRNSNEMDKAAALREFEEETGYLNDDIIA